MSEERPWQGATYGSGWLHKMLILSIRFIHIRLLYAFAAIFVIPVCMVVNKTGMLIYRYLRKHHDMSPCKAFWGSYKNHCLFSQVVIDRFAVYAGKEFKLQVKGYENYKQLAKKSDGFMQFSAHVGNYEMAGYMLDSKDKPLNVLVFQDEKASVMDNRRRQFKDTHIKMINIGHGMDYVFEIQRALTNGEVVSMPADRVVGSKRTVELPFLNGKAKFPLGPFRVCATMGENVFCVNTMKTKWNEYTVFVTPLSYDKQTSRNEQVKQISEAYVNELERILRQFPYQWYNYFEFWN